MQLTVSLLFGLYVKIGRIEGIERIVFTFHWYIGIAPPFMAVDMKVTEYPGQKGLDDADMIIAAGNAGFTAIVTELDSAGFPEGQRVLEFRVQVIASPLAGT